MKVFNKIKNKIRTSILRYYLTVEDGKTLFRDGIYFYKDSICDDYIVEPEKGSTSTTKLKQILELLKDYPKDSILKFSKADVFVEDNNSLILKYNVNHKLIDYTIVFDFAKVTPESKGYNKQCIMLLLEMIEYFTEHKLSVEKLELSDFLYAKDTDKSNKICLVKLHKLEVVEDYDTLCEINIRWLLNKIEGVFKINSTSNIMEYIRDFYYSNDLLNIYYTYYNKSTDNKCTMEFDISHILGVIKKELDNLDFGFDIEKFKFVGNPKLTSFQIVNLMEDEIETLYNHINVNKKDIDSDDFFFIHSDNLDNLRHSFFFFKPGKDEKFQASKISNMEFIAKSSSFEDLREVISGFIFSNKYNHPIGYIIKDSRIFSKNEYGIQYKDGDSIKLKLPLFKAIGCILEEFESLSTRGYVFKNDIKIDDILYWRGKVCFSNFYDIISISSIKKNMENTGAPDSIIDGIKERYSKVFLELLKGHLKYQIDEKKKKVVYDNVYNLDIKITTNLGKYLIDGVCDYNEFYEGIFRHYKIETFFKGKVEECEVFSDMGKEAIVYDTSSIQKDTLGKIYRVDDKQQFVSEIDIGKKKNAIRFLLNNYELSRKENLMHGFEIIGAVGVIIDEVSNSICGLMMKKVNNSKSAKILTDRIQRKKYQITNKEVLKILIFYANAIEFLHQMGICIGDVSYNNVLFDVNNYFVSMIDMDSINIGESNSTLFTADFVDPLSIKEDGYCKPSFEADWYAFATLAFYTLTLVHPFGGVYIKNGKNLPIPIRKAQRISVLGEHTIKVPPIAISWDWMGDDLKNAFLDIFEGNKRYNISNYLIAEYHRLYCDTITYLDEDIIYKDFVHKYKDMLEIKTNNSNTKVVVNLNQGCINNDAMHESNLICKNIARNESLKYITKDVLVDLKAKKIVTKKGDVSIDSNLSIDSVYVSNRKVIYVMLEDKRICAINLRVPEHLVKVIPLDGIICATEVPYTDDIILLSEYGNIAKASYLTKEKTISYYYDPDLRRSKTKYLVSGIHINTRGGNNDTDDVMNQLKGLLDELNLLEDKLCGLTLNIYGDLILNKWLVISDLCSFIYDPKTNEKIDIEKLPEELKETSLNRIIFFDKAVYFPIEKAIFSINLINGNSLTFKCDKVDKTSRIEIIKEGFRIYGDHEINDLVHS